MSATTLPGQSLTIIARNHAHRSNGTKEAAAMKIGLCVSMLSGVSESKP